VYFCFCFCFMLVPGLASTSYHPCLTERRGSGNVNATCSALTYFCFVFSFLRLSFSMHLPSLLDALAAVFHPMLWNTTAAPQLVIEFPHGLPIVLPPSTLDHCNSSPAWGIPLRCCKIATVLQQQGHLWMQNGIRRWLWLSWERYIGIRSTSEKFEYYAESTTHQMFPGTRIDSNVITLSRCSCLWQHKPKPRNSVREPSFSWLSSPCWLNVTL